MKTHLETRYNSYISFCGIRFWGMVGLKAFCLIWNRKKITCQNCLRLSYKKNNGKEANKSIEKEY